MLLAVVVIVVVAVVVYLVKEKLEHWLNCVKIVRKLAYLISFFIHYGVSASRAN